MRGAIDLPGLEELLQRQDQVVSRAQLRRLGADDGEVRRLLRRRELVMVVAGVYVAHTGPLTPAQREWAAVLACWPAALSHRSALPDPADRSRSAVHVAVARDRGSLSAIDGVVVHRLAAFTDRVEWRHPPRVRVEQALLDVLAPLLAADQVAEAFGVLTRTVGTRRTTVERVGAALVARSRYPGRALLTDLLSDLATGACSVLERGYLHRVERAHGLPAGRRQHRTRADGRTTYVDVDYRDFGVLVELDGRAFHDGPLARDRDAERDLVQLAERDRRTARLTFGLVFGGECVTAARVGRLLARGGWTGELTPCPQCRRAA